MSKIRVARSRRESGPKKPARTERGVVPPSGHSFVTLLGLPSSDTADLRERIREGLSYRSWDQFLETSGLPKEAIIQVVGMTARTLARRR